MSNDVHLARVSKIQRSADVSKFGGGEAKNISRRSAVRSTKEVLVSSSVGGSGGGTVDSTFGCVQTLRTGESKGGLVNEMESPDHTQRDNNESDNNISSCSTLDIGKVENLSLQQLETQVRDLTQRLQHADQQRVELQHKLEDCSAEKELCLRRLEVVSAAHECRITEMHCVIAELSKKLRAKQETIIPEEQEPEGSDLSFQEEGSVYNSELNLTNPDAECQTDPLDSGAEHSLGDGCDNIEDNQRIEESEPPRMSEVVSKGQVEALQEEILHLKAQIALLQSEIANSLHVNDSIALAEQNRNTELLDEDTEANETSCSVEQPLERVERIVPVAEVMTPADFVTPLKPFEPLSSPQKSPPVAKMAERIKLRCGSKTEPCQQSIVTASDLLNTELKNPNIIEHLVADLKQHDKSMMDSFTEPTQVDTELQRLQRKVEHLKVRNTILSLTLDECKEHCEHLYLLCGKYESNAIALQSAVNCSDRAIEAYDVMLALLESKLALMTDKSIAAEDSRRAVESVARHLLDRLESEKNVCENSLGPWQSTFSIPDKACTPWTTDDDNRLRYHVSKLKGRRSTVQNTIVNLESPFSDLFEKSRLIIESGSDLIQQEKSAQMDLETAVLMQELLNLREENIALKLKVETIDAERRHATDRNGMLQEALQQLQLQLQLQMNADTTSALFHRDQIAENRLSYSEAEHAALTEQQLVEALTRESELKSRIQALISSVAASQRNADEKHVKMQNNMQELQKSNLSLTQLLEQNKRKYQARVRKLEQKIMEMSMLLEQRRKATPLADQSSDVICGGTTQSSFQTHENVPETTL